QADRHGRARAQLWPSAGENVAILWQPVAVRWPQPRTRPMLCSPAVSDQPFDRVVAIGDLNGAFDVLCEILLGTGVIDRDERWRGGRTHLIQIGDIFNRGGGARAAFELLGALTPRAAAAGGRVTVLLGNHEVMTALGNEAYCTADEYLAFASVRQRRTWPGRVSRAQSTLYRDHPDGGPIEPLAPRLEAWKISNVPGRAAMRRALGPRAKLGRALRQLPVVTRSAGCLFCHGGLTPRWARLGIDGINQRAAQAWAEAPPFFRDLPRTSLFTASRGPLWNRDYALRDNVRVRNQLTRALDQLGAKRMVVGHTQTRHVAGGEPGRIALRHDDRLVCIDVGLGCGDPSPCTALVIAAGEGREWTPDGERVLWRDRRPSQRKRQRK
ncbi:MAG: metallophosphoesterase, partial [Myxococcota bacterium]